MAFCLSLSKLNWLRRNERYLSVPSSTCRGAVSCLVLAADSNVSRATASGEIPYRSQNLSTEVPLTTGSTRDCPCLMRLARR